MLTAAPPAAPATTSEPCRRAWVAQAIARLEAESARSADTHLLRLELPKAPGIALYLKDESRATPPAASSTAWRARCSSTRCATAGSGRTTIVEASSGSTAVSEAYFARLLGLGFIAVMPRRHQPRRSR